MEQVFLDILTFLSPQGYYARSRKEKQIFKLLESKSKVIKKKSTKSTYILAQSRQEIENNLNFIDHFLIELKSTFSKLRSNYRPFVSLQEIWDHLQSKLSLTSKDFEKFLLKFYEEGIIDLEQSLTNNENENGLGIKSRNGKLFYYILDIF